jgi:murein DD-endopeptidase MepM/ murein hydrolase activator NlpD
MRVFLALGERLGGLVRRPRRLYFAVALPLAIPLLLATYPTAQSAAPRPAAAPLPPPELRYADLAATPDARLPAHSLILTLEDGDTLDSILVEGGLTRGESATLNNRFGQFVDLRRLRPGHLLRFHYGPSDRVESVQMKVLGWGLLDAVRNGETFEVTARQADVRELETDVAATIDSSLYEALRQAGEGPQLVQQLVDVFQWDIDFFALKKGDSFSLVVTKKFAGSDLVGYGPIKAARFTHEGTTYEAFRHESADGRAGYYARAGTPLRKQFLRAPLQFTRITSGFSKKRFHPLLHYFRPHHGVDYGAPTGTPVMTTADGVVLEASYSGGEGNFVRIRHTSRIETSYLHLSRFAKGIKRGSKVMQGDVIGFVGMTGLATGPHLDYRVSDDGTWLDPLKLKSITPDPLGSAELRTFRADVGRLAPRLNAPAGQVAQAAPKRRALF